MIPGFEKIVKCPYCGAEKSLMTIMTGNNFGAEYWSDNKVIAPHLPEVSPVQKCMHCGKYYLEYKQEAEIGKKDSIDTGDLTYDEWKEALRQFEAENTEQMDMDNVRFWLIQAYNDFFYRSNNTNTPTEEDFRFIIGIINDFVNLYDWSGVEIPLLKAELYREANEMDKCKEVLSRISLKDMNDVERQFFEEVKERVEESDNKVFLRMINQ